MAEGGEAAEKRILNVNLGVLGHIDSGKTSLAKSLSTVASTASFDKNPQSQARGITLDLGFSSFSTELPAHLQGLGYDSLQYTLVDCPGHASLIKTIIGGAQIIDLMVLVIDVTKGIQTQTAECLVIGEITCSKLVVVLNKADLIPEAGRQEKIEKVKQKLNKVFDKTRFPNPPMVPVAAKPGGPDSAQQSFGIPELIATLHAHTTLPIRSRDPPFIFSVDHCFAIKGQGTVLTGTVLHGSVQVNDTIEIPALKQTKKVKSMQMFRKSIQSAQQGDRLGICVTQFDPTLLERGVVCNPGALPTITAAIARVQKIRFFKGAVTTKSRFHVSLGHATVMCTASFFNIPQGEGVARDWPSTAGAYPPQVFDFSREFRYAEELIGEGGSSSSSSSSGDKAGGESADGASAASVEYPAEQYAVLEFDTPVTCTPDALIIASRLDVDANANTCRLAFHGRLAAFTCEDDYKTAFLPKVRVFKTKVRSGTVDRLHDSRTIIGKNLFKKETQMDKFTGLEVVLSTGERGKIEGAFGQSGKFKVYFSDGLKDETLQMLQGSGKKKGKKAEKADAGEEGEEGEGAKIEIFLNFKRYVFDPEKQMVQS